MEDLENMTQWLVKRLPSNLEEVHIDYIRFALQQYAVKYHEKKIKKANNNDDTRPKR